MARNIRTLAMFSIAASVVIAGCSSTASTQTVTEVKPPTELQWIHYPLPTSAPCNTSQPVNNLVDNLYDNDTATQPEVDEGTSVQYSEEDLNILALIIYQEAGGNTYSDDTRRKVGSVFLNRVKSGTFPNTFEEVATAKQQYGTLYWTGIQWPERASYPEEAKAVQRAYTTAEDLLINGSILPHNVIWQAEFIQGDGIYCYQDEIYFCYTGVIK